MSRTLLICICIFLVIAFAVAYGDLYHKYKEERYMRIFSEALIESYKDDIDHCWQLYVDCLNQDEDSPNTNGLTPAPWNK